MSKEALRFIGTFDLVGTQKHKVNADINIFSKPT